LRITLAILGLFGFITLQILNGKEYLTTLTPENLQIAAGFLLNIHTSLTASFPMLFLGLGLTLFNYLFFKSKYIPRTLSSLGILSYSLIFLFAFISILLPEHNTIVQIICWTPSIFFELIIGLWLLFKGINIQAQDFPARESV
jgi:hypothetical protein